MSVLLILLLVSFPLGHLVRLEVAQGIAVYPNDLIAGLMAMVVIAKALKTKSLPKAKLTYPIVLFSLVAALSLLQGSRTVELPELMTGSLYLLRWMLLTAVYFFTLTLPIERGLKVLRRAVSYEEVLLLSGLSLAALGIVQYVIFPDMTQFKWIGWDDHAFRLVGTLLDPGFTGIILVLTALLAMRLSEPKPVKIAAVTLSTLALLLTYSRSSYLAFLAGFLVFGWMIKKLGKALLGIFLFLLFLVFLPKAASEGTNLLRQYSFFNRVETWEHAAVMIRDHPALGVGFNLLRYAQKRYHYLGEDWKTSHSGAGVENSYLFILVTTGIIGGSAFAWLIYKINKLWLAGSERGGTGKALGLASLAALATHGVFNNSWFYPWVLVWMWMLIALKEATLRKKPSA